MRSRLRLARTRDRAVASRAAAAHQVNQERLEPLPKSYSDDRRSAPHYADEPIAGFEWNINRGPVDWQQHDAGPVRRPYYTDKNTHDRAPKFTGLDLGATNLKDEQTLETVYRENHPLGQAVIEGLAQAIPGVPTAKRLAEGKAPTLGTAATEAANVAGLLGANEFLAPVRAARAAVTAKRSGGSVIDAFQAARQGIARGTTALTPKPVFKSASRDEYAKTLQSAGYTKKEQKALLDVHDQVALAYSDRVGVPPSDAWDRIYSHSQYHDMTVTNHDVETGRVVFAQEGKLPEIHNLAATPNGHVDLPDTGAFFKRQSANLVRKHRGALPDAHATPKKLEGLLNELRERALSAEQYKDWYERSGHAILQHVGNDPAEADKLAALIAVYSPQAAVYSKTTEWNNLDRAISAYDSYRATGEIPSSLSISKTSKRDWQTEVASQIMQGHFEWGGLKINRFYRNFLQHIDPTKYESLFGTERFGTMDSWMQRAFHYANERYTTGRHLGELKAIPAPSKKQYAFMETANRIIADSLGWSPEEAQAAIWTSIKAEEEGTPIEEAGFHFGDALAHRAARVSGENLNGLPEDRFSTPAAQWIAREYMNERGMPYAPPTHYVKVDATRAKRIAEWYDHAESAPNDPAVRVAYDAMARETLAQYEAITRDGYVFEFYPENDPYPTGPSQAIDDLRANKHLYVFPTERGFGSEGKLGSTLSATTWASACGAVPPRSAQRTTSVQRC
jgi:hypothetical protein